MENERYVGPFSDEPPSSVPPPANAIPQMRWRIIPTMFIGAFGLIGTGLGACMVFFAVRQFMRLGYDPALIGLENELRPRFVHALLVSALIFGWGMFWTGAAYGIWRRRWVIALVVFALGIACLVAGVNWPKPVVE